MDVVGKLIHITGDLKTWLAKTADDEGKNSHDPFCGRGFVNARRAVTE
jgi:hypothetical protein